MKYVEGWTDFSSKSDEQAGNYLVLKINSVPSDAVTSVEVVNGTSGPVTLDEDKNIVLRIADKSTQKVKVLSSKSGQTKTETYGLSGLVCEEKE